MDVQALGELLVEAGAMPRVHLADVMRQQQGPEAVRGELETVLIEQEEAVAEILADRSQTPALVFATSHINLSALAALPAGLVREHQILPLSLDKGVLTVAAACADPGTVVAELGVLAGARVVVVVAASLILELAIERALALLADGQTRLRGARCRDDDVVIVMARPPQRVKLPRADSVALALQAVFDGSGAPLTAFSSSSALATLRLKQVPARNHVEPIGAHAAPVAAVAPASSRPFVLIVEDDAAISRLMAMALGTDGYDIVEVGSGDAVGPALRTRRPDAMILDAMLPGVRGFEICAALKHSVAWADLPIVMVSAVYRGCDQAREIQEVHGADAFIEKPFKIDQLRFVVADLLARPAPANKHSPQQTLSQARARALVDHHLTLGDVDAATAVIGHWLAEDPLSGRAWLEQGHLAVQAGDAFGALRAYELASTYERDLFVAHLSLAMLYEQLGFARRARVTWEKAAAHAPDVDTAQRIRHALKAVDQPHA